jgi:hypothetical protein
VIPASEGCYDSQDREFGLRFVPALRTLGGEQNGGLIHRERLRFRGKERTSALSDANRIAVLMLRPNQVAGVLKAKAKNAATPRKAKAAR